MKKKWILMPGCLLVFIMGCQNADKKDSAASELRAKADSMRQEAINEHNRGMGGWSRIEGRQMQIQKWFDSVKTLPAATQSSLSSLATSLNEAKEELGNAFKAMNDWMMVMSLDSAADNPEVRMEYYTNERIKGSEITPMINNSLHKADSLLQAGH